MSAQLKLIVGLGNPGAEHILTRHNAGFWFLDSLAEKFSLNFTLDKKFQSELCRYQNNDVDCWLCKPQTYMNVSGSPIGEIVNYFKIPKSKILIIHDDLDLVVGKVKIKIGGGNGGHNGLSSIDQAIGKNYKRLRIGIGRPGSKDLVSSYVLKKFNKADRKIIEKIIEVLTELFSLIFYDKELLLTKLSLKIKKN